ncbi:MAG: DUF4831 family protein [Alistipes sp.]|nr:DUF4831 family protein [Alistipes sp.]
MKNIFVTVLMLCFAGAVSAQSLTRAGFYMDNGQAVLSNPKSSVTVSVTVEKSHFVPGEFARYAQKMLGVRASLTEHKESKILSSAIYDKQITTPLQKSVVGGDNETVLPAFRADNRALSVEQQAQAAADMIFSLRRHRKELITGDAGENVFGAGLRSALNQIAAMEQQCLDMFYGTTTTTVEEYRYTITPTAEEKNYVVCRYRDEEGILPVSELSAEPLMLVFTPAQVDTSKLPLATVKDKVVREYIVVPTCSVELLLGTQTLCKGEVSIPQYGTSVSLSVK